jgi:hypothetical protein
LRRLLQLFALLLVGTACSGADNGRCVELSNDAIDLYQEFITAVDEFDLAGAVASEEGMVIPGQGALESRADKLQVEADATGCEDQELRQLIAERFVRLEARTVFGQAVLDEIRREGLFFDS